MTYQLKEQMEFWGDSMSLTQGAPLVKHTYYNIKKDWKEIHSNAKSNCVRCMGITSSVNSIDGAVVVGPVVSKQRIVSAEHPLFADNNTAVSQHDLSANAVKHDDGKPALVQTPVINNQITKMKDNFDKAMDKLAVKHDAGKADWSLVPWDAVEEVVKVLHFGAIKYNEAGQGPSTWNWTKGSGLGKWRTLAAVFRHLTSYAKGETFDQESGLNHLAHAACGILFLLYYHKHPEKYGNFE